MTTPMQRYNLNAGTLVQDESDPPGYGARFAPVGPEVGAERLKLNLFEVEPGQSLCPYHYEYVEEWLIVLHGTVSVRTPDGEDTLVEGDTVCFPAGPGGAHKVSNRSGANARVIMFSVGDEPAVAVYPDSDKIGVWPGLEKDKIMVRRGSGVDYWEGEHEDG